VGGDRFGILGVCGVEARFGNVGVCGVGELGRGCVCGVGL
jgi:hypothetical protein